MKHRSLDTKDHVIIGRTYETHIDIIRKCIVSFVSRHIVGVRLTVTQLSVSCLPFRLTLYLIQLGLLKQGEGDYAGERKVNLSFKVGQ